MKVKDFKEIISSLPDEDNLYFEYCGIFENVDRVFQGEEINEHFKQEYDADYKFKEHDWMIVFD